MKKILFLLALLCLEKTLHAQRPYIYTIKADSVKITNNCDTAELIIENHTQNVPGFLFNKGRGRTEFRRAMLRITDSLYLFGGDTLRLNPWLQGGNRFGTIGSFGTMDNNHIDLYSNGIKRGRLTNNGSLQLGEPSWDNQDRLQVCSTGVVSISGNLSRPNDRIQIGRGMSGGDGQNAIIRTSSDGGAIYRDILVERDGHIGIGKSDRVGGWMVGNPAIRIYEHGVVNIASTVLGFGAVGGEHNASCLVTRVSNPNEWNSGQGNYPSRQHYYYFGTSLNLPEPGNIRANLVIGARELNFMSGATDNPAMTVLESQNVMIGGGQDNGHKLQVNGTFAQQGGWNAIFGNNIGFDRAGNIPRIISHESIVYQSNSAGDQHTFKNEIAENFKGTLVTIDPGNYPGLPNNQLALNVYGKSHAAGLAVNMAGYVGIGTAIPVAQLHTTGSVRFGGLTANNSLNRVLVSDANGNLFFREASLASNGVMNSDLAVNGSVSAQNMRITQTGPWPDYVFSKQYKLPTLPEVESFIEKNSHLPGVPSAAEVTKKGIDVAETQAALLKKIEELTLYAIEQNKKVQAQEAEINQLKKRNEEMEVLKKQIKELSVILGDIRAATGSK